MKKIVLALLALMLPASAQATYTILRDASNLSRGTLPNARLDPSSVTLLGNNFNGSTQLTQTDSNGQVPNSVHNPSSVTLQGNGFNGSSQLLKLDSRAFVAKSLLPASISGFDIVVGSVAGTGVDISSTNEDGLKIAVQTLCGSSNAAVCLPGGTILYRSGVYSIQETTIPFGVTLYALPGSSVVFRNKSNTLQMLRINGVVDGINFDFNGSAVANKMIQVHSSGTIRNSEFRNASGMTNAGAMIYVENAFNATASNIHFRDAMSLGSGGLRISSSQYTSLFDFVVDSVTASASGNVFIYVLGSSNTVIQNHQVNNAGNGRYVLFSGGQNHNFVGNRITVTAPITGAGNALVMVNSEDSLKVTSSTYIANNVITTNLGDASIFFKCRDVTTRGIEGVLFTGNVVRNTNAAANTLTAFSITDSGCNQTVLTNNSTYGINTFISDSGTATKSATLLNMKDGIQQ